MNFRNSSSNLLRALTLNNAYTRTKGFPTLALSAAKLSSSAIRELFLKVYVYSNFCCYSCSGYVRHGDASKRTRVPWKLLDLWWCYWCYYRSIHCVHQNFLLRLTKLWTINSIGQLQTETTKHNEIRQLVLRASATVTNSRSGHVSCFSGGSKIRCDCDEYKSSSDAFRSDLNLWNRHRWPRCFGKASPLSQIVICSSQTQSVHFSLFLQRLPIGTDFYER